MRSLVNFALRAAVAVSLRVRAAIAVATARQHSKRRLLQSAPRRILVVCYGNIYRSAFVGVMLRDRLHARGVEVRSAGFHPVAGRPSPERHVRLSQAHGVALGDHRSAVIDSEDIAWADLIVLMDRHNWAALRSRGAREDKLIWLGALVPGSVEIPDPYELGEEEAARIVARMYLAGEQLANSIAGESRPPLSTPNPA